jgi:hypothetical protein
MNGFIPSPYCKSNFREHRREEIDEDVLGNPKVRVLGTCRICGGVREYPYTELVRYGDIIPPPRSRDFVPFHDKPERHLHMNRHLVGGA